MASPQEDPEAKARASQVGGEAGLTLAELASKQDVVMMEQKLAAMRNLIVFTVILVVIAAGLLLYQNRLIERNRQELNSMRAEAMEFLMPALNERLKSFDARLEKSQAAFDGIDVKVQAAEDRFMVRINQELPAMLDREIPKILNKYIDQRLRDIRREPTEQK